jgi:predicted RNase H-like HicB family nuclease
MTLQYTVIFERAPSNWAAYVPDLPGCMSPGRSLDETKVNIREAIEGHLATLRALGDPVPEPCILAGEVEVSPAVYATRG